MNIDMNLNPAMRYSKPKFSHKGMVATSQPIAAQIGRDILKSGGNAVDAAVATAATLTVLEPTSNGIGGDAFAIVWFKDKLYGLNSSGKSPELLTAEDCRKKGFDKIPVYGWTPVTVPGAPGAWAELIKRFGKLSLEDVLTPAIKIAKDGFVVTPVVQKYWEIEYKKMKQFCNHSLYKHWFNTFTKNEQSPKIGEVFALPDHAKTLDSISKTNSESFYRGEIAEKIHAHSVETGGYIRREDLAAFEVEWVNPVEVSYKGYDICELPPNGQGLIALQAIKIFEKLNQHTPGSIEYFHHMIESLKLAFVDGKEHITQIDQMKYTIDDLLCSDYIQKRASMVSSDTAINPSPGNPTSGGTVYLSTADEEGNMVSFIQSNYKAFGSGIVIPGTGIALQNRGVSFSLDENKVNCLNPGKKPLHTIIPGFLMKEGKPIGPFGVMGGFMQPQGHMQVILNTINLNLNPQAVLDYPRWQWIGGKTIEVEKEFPSHILEGLIAKGHDIRINPDFGEFGRGQIIWKLWDKNIYCGGSEIRADGNAEVL